ncbi:MAG: 50S ribosomal protein L9 [Erysipelotrichaceae bacterium]|nr:50S ribosomal protein L9 [Erysipelotrichaceae bacterium]
MKVIMLSDVKKVGKKDEVVEVSDGYAKNFLFKQNLAIPCSNDAMKILKHQKADEAERQEELKHRALKIKEELKTKEYTFEVKASNGRVFNSVSTKNLSERLAEDGYDIDKRKFIDREPITTLGYSIIKVELYKNVIGEIKVLLKEKK